VLRAGGSVAGAGRPAARSDGVGSCGVRVATTSGRTVAGGAIPRSRVGVTLAATGCTLGAPRTGWSCRTSAVLTRTGRASPRAKRSAGTPTTAFATWTLRYTVMLVTFTVVRLTITLLTTRGPPHPAHVATPANPRRPHHGITGSPQPSGAQQSGWPGVRPPRKTTSAGA
jgi:hypothetical protein